MVKSPPPRRALAAPPRAPAVAQKPAAPHPFGTAAATEAPPPWVVDADALYREATAHAGAGRLQQAVDAFDRLLRLKPEHADALNDRGNALDLLRRRAEALDSYERALRIRPDHIHALNGRANMLQAFGRLDEALDGYAAAIAIDARYVHAWNGRGNTLLALGRHRDALADYLHAQQLRPDLPDPQFNEALVRLTLGEFEAGWRKHEWRWSLPFWRPRLRGFTQPAWLGESDPRGRVLLLHAEQGFGDTLQFCRYVPLVAATGARVVLEVQPALRTLLGQLPGVETLVARGDALPPFDAHCPLLSLPLAMGTRVFSIPPPLPRLQADPERAAAWAARLGPRRGLRVGVAWQGNTGHDNDRNRSIPLARFTALLAPACADAPPVEFVSLHPQVPPRDRDLLPALPALRDVGDGLNDFADTAALVAHLDLVIAVDTSVAHLAAAMGRPTWILLPHPADWRWMLDRDDSPWYPAVRLFRQTHADDWDAVLARVRATLAPLASATAGVADDAGAGDAGA